MNGTAQETDSIEKPAGIDPTPEPKARFLRACRRLPVDATPVWFMRQAGRYMPEYRAIRARYTLLEIMQRPEIAAEITIQPVEALGVDAAILFADILLPVVPMGFLLEFVKGEGPVIHNPVRCMDDVRRLRRVDVESDLGHVLETVRLARQALEDKQVPLIGFAGAPFTVASYLLEGGPSRDYLQTKRLMYSESGQGNGSGAWGLLMDTLAETLGDYLVAQIEAGAQAVQLFDSWVGVLSPGDYAHYVLPYSQKVLARIKTTGVPAIHFGTGTATLLPLMKTAGGDVIGLDWRVPLDAGWQAVGRQVAVQGNLDPAALFAPIPVLREKVEDILRRAGGTPGHIFNLGHGILPETRVENVRAVVDMVHEWPVR